MERSAWDVLRELASEEPEAVLLSASDGKAFIDRLAEGFVNDRERAWWWEEVSGVVARIPYGTQDGLEVLRKRFGDELEVRLIVTDEHREPAGVIGGPANVLLRLLGEAPFFEFALADPELRWMAFDTHHNEIILAGDPPSG